MQQIARRRTLADEVHDELRRQIVTLELLPGTVLADKMLGERFGVSRTPLREALLRLAQSGLVIVAPQHATFVAPLDPDAVREAQFLRENLEPPVLRRLCSSPPADLTELHELLVEQRLLLARGALGDFLALDDRFHETLFRLAGLGGIWAMLQARKAQLDRLRHVRPLQPEAIAGLIDEHEAILDAVEARDARAAETALLAHVSAAARLLDEIARERPELFTLPESRARATRKPGDQGETDAIAAPVGEAAC